MLSENFTTLFQKTDSVVVAFSGGPDSVFLVEQLLKNGYKNVVLAHFNHHMKVRSGGNDRDEEFVKKYALQRDVMFEIGHWDFPENSEEKARKARYEFLEKIRQKYNASVIITGHHKNDVAETVLLQFFRSGGVKSLSGITEYDRSRNLFRPILHLFKADILAFLDKNNIIYCIDSSNLENIFLRNFLRNDVIPLLETRFPNIQEHLYIQASQFKNLENDIEKQASLFLEKQDIDMYIKNSNISSAFNVLEYLSEITEVQAEILRTIMVGKAFSRTFFLEFISFLQKHIKDKISGKKIETKYQVFTVKRGVLFVASKGNAV